MPWSPEGTPAAARCWSRPDRYGPPTSWSSPWPSGSSTAAAPSPGPRPHVHDFPPWTSVSQDEDHDAISEVARRSAAKPGWPPGFIDYLYVSVTNSSAFSPTDTMPLSPRAKLLMGTESISAILLSVLVIARAVSLLQ